MNNFVCATKLVMDADQAITLTQLVAECHRLNKILDEEINEEGILPEGDSSKSEEDVSGGSAPKKDS